MTSPDGITWTARTAASNDDWYAVTHGDGVFTAVGTTGTSRVMISGAVNSPVLDPSQWTTHYQALPMPESDSCTDISAAENQFAAYGVNVTGGWVRAWEPWVNDGNGGWACRRNLINTGGTNWIITN
jgi:hypothetical protein